MTPSTAPDLGQNRGFSRRSLFVAGAVASAAAAALSFRNPQRASADVVWGFPLAKYTNPSYGYGIRDGRLHAGIDYPDGSSPTVFSIADGVINNVATHVNYGRFVEIEHFNGWSSFYAHLSSQSVFRGAQIWRGDPIGVMGNTGASFGIHLHLEMRTRPGGATFDPAPYVNRSSPLPGNPPVPIPISMENDMPIHIQRQSTGDTWVVVPGVYIKHHPDGINGNVSSLLTTGSTSRADFRLLSDSDLSVAMWDLGFPELGGDLKRIPYNGQYHWAANR